MKGGWYRDLVTRPLLQQKGRTLATVVAVALGVAVPIAIFQANQGAVSGFASAVEMMAGDAGWEITAPGGLDESRLPELSWLREYGLASPVIEGHAILPKTSGNNKDRRLAVLGVDLLRDAPVRGYRWLEFSGGRTTPTSQEMLNLISEPDAVVLPNALASREEWKVGDTFTVVMGDQPVSLTIRALLHDEGPARALGGDLLILDIGAAQRWLGRPGRVDRIDLRLWEPAPEGDEWRAGIAARLPPGWTLQAPVTRGDAGKTMLASFQFNLTMLGGMSLLVGLFLVHQAISVSVITRRREMGLLRTVGMGRAALTGIFLGQTLLFLLAGVAIGVPVGQLLASQMIRLTSTAVETLYVAVSAQVPSLPAQAWWWAFGVTLPLGLLAAAGPLREAFRHPPLSLVRPPPGQTPPASRWLALGCAVTLAGAWILARLPAWHGIPLAGYFATALLVLATLFAVPLSFRLFLAAASHIAPGKSVVLRLAISSMRQGLGRISLSTAALATALALTTAIAVMVASFRVTVTDWIDQNMAADLYLRSTTQTRGGEEVALSAELISYFDKHPGIAAIDHLRTFDVPFRGSLLRVGGADFAVSSERGRLRFKTPDTDQSLLKTLIGQRAVVLSESLAIRQGFIVGDSFPLPTPAGELLLPIAGIYRDYSNDRGSVMMDRALLDEIYGAQPPTNLALYVAPDQDPATLREEMLAEISSSRSVLLFTQKDLRQEVVRIFDSTFSITWALEAIAALMAMAGIAICLYTLFLEQRPDWHMLRILGTSTPQLRGIAMTQAAIIGFISQFLGLLLGLAMAMVLVFVINVQSFGWTIEFRPPWMILGVSLVLVPLFTCSAGWLSLKRVFRNHSDLGLPGQAG